MGSIGLITDYGTADWFAGEMKGAILGISPDTTIIDITHNIPPGDIKCAAFSLLACFRSFPAQTVFCVVVDPGVGTSRAALAIKAGPRYFIGPDNGVLSWAILREEKREIRRIETADLLPDRISSTFHGRDIFGPIAAHLAAGAAFEKIGPLTDTMIEIPWPSPVGNGKGITGSVVHIDRFGNAVSSIDEKTIRSLSGTPTIKLLKYGTELPFCTHFQQVPTGKGLAYVGSSGFLEIAINNANAAAIFGLHIGDSITVQ
ncbi:MAG: SAM-dependent chlorinase/fluorinase [Chitinispirillaceae bacterium]|nr:SAM-dependent chlorinase/fluorinase [Chitinispirillaceae bacterium]